MDPEVEEYSIGTEIRRIVILNFLTIAFLAIWQSAIALFKTGQLKFVSPDMYDVVFFLVLVNIGEVFFFYLPKRKAASELKLKGYAVSEISVNESQFRKVEIELDFDAVCELCINYLKTLTDCKIVKQDLNKGFIKAIHTYNAEKPTRHRIEFKIEKQSDNKTVVIIQRGTKRWLEMFYSARNYILMEETVKYLNDKTGSSGFRVLEGEDPELS